MDKFAILDYVKNKDEIPVRFNILKKAPDFIWDWYIKKFNPLSVEKINFDFADGFLIKLPIEKCNTDYKLAASLLFLTLKSFPQVKIICLPDYFSYDYESCAIKISNGNLMFAFLAIDAIKKFSHVIQKEFANLEIFIIDKNHLLTQILIDNIYPHVNYLTVITNEKNIYNKKEHSIFAETGLNIQILSYNKSIIENADIIINTGFENKFDYAIKRNSLYFDLGSKKNDFCQLKIKRPDIFAFNSLNLYCMDKSIDNVILEMAMYCICSDFKKITDGFYNEKLYINVLEKLKKLNVKISSFQKY